MPDSADEYAELMAKYTRQLMLDSWIQARVAAGEIVTLEFSDRGAGSPEYRAQVGSFVGRGDTLYTAIANAKGVQDPKSAHELLQERRDLADWNPAWGKKPAKPGDYKP